MALQRVLCLFGAIILCSFAFNKIGLVTCDDSIEKSNLEDLVENRSSDLHTRSVLPSERGDREEEKVLRRPVSDSILSEIREAADRVSSKKCRKDIALAVDGIQRNQHWALESKWAAP